LKRRIAELIESDNRTAIFDLLSSVKRDETAGRADFIDCVIYTARQLLGNNLVHECFMLLRSSHDRQVTLFGEPVDYTLFEEIGNMYYLLGQPKEAVKWYT
jgi:hypothetical protein